MIKVIPSGPFSVNTLIVSLEGSDVFVVDPAGCSYTGDENTVDEYLTDLNLNLRAIVLTHGHFDHTCGLKDLKNKYPSVPVLIHKNDSAYLGSESEIEQSKTLSALGMYDFIPFVSKLPFADYFLEDGKTLSQCMNAEDSAFSKWRVIHTPGHTKGSVCIYNEEEKILISGDTVFYHSYGRTDFEGGSERVMQKTLENIYTFIPKDTRLYPGHDTYGFMLKDNLIG